jgi:hypothetical protein
MKKEYFLLIFAIVALSAYLFLHNRDKDNYLLPQIPEIDEAKIESIEIIKNDQAINCYKHDGKWVVTKKKFPGNAMMISQMLASIKNLTLTTLISEQGNLKRYDLDKTKSINVVAKDKNSILRSFSIGKTAPTQKHTFIILDDQKNIFHAKGNLRRIFNKTIDNLRDKQIQKISMEDIKSIELSKGNINKSIIRKELSKDDTKSDTKEKLLWQAQDDDSLKQEPVNNLVGTLSDLRCSSFLENQTKKDFENKTPLFKIILKTEQIFELTLYPKTDQNKYPGISSRSKYLFLLEDYVADDIISNINKLLNIKQ